MVITLSDGHHRLLRTLTDASLHLCEVGGILDGCADARALHTLVLENHLLPCSLEGMRHRLACLWKESLQHLHGSSAGGLVLLHGSHHAVEACQGHPPQGACLGHCRHLHR